MINPEDNVVIGSQSKLGHITDVAVTNNEIFILRKNTNRNLIRIGMYPEGRGDSLYHRLIQEKEKFGLHPPPDSPSPVIQDTKHGSHSPLHFIQTNILDKIAGPSHKSKPVENLISNLESMNLELNSEAADHEIDHSEIDTSSINKETNQSMEDLPPVVKLASPDLLTVEIFGENSSQTKSSTNQRPERVNPFLRDGNIDDVQKEDNDSGYDRNNSLESSQKSLTDTGSFGVMEERLQNINVTEDASDDIVFTSKPKKHKKKRKGFKTPDIGDFSMERSSSDKSLHLSADRGITTPDSVSIASVTSETSEDSATSDNQRQSMPEADRAGAINSTISVDAPSVETGDQSFEEEVSGKKSEVGISEDTAQESKDSLIPYSVLEDINQKVSKKQEEKTHGPKNLKHRDKFERIEKQLHEFERSLPEELVPEDLSRSFGKNVKKAESCPTDSQKQARKTENENSEDVSCKDSHVTSSQKSLRRQESSEPSIYSIYRSPDSKAEFFASPEYLSPTSPSSTGTSSTEDFYQKYSSSSYSLSSLTGTAEHPLTKRKEEDEDDSHSEDKLESIQVSGPSEEIPSQKLINNWSDIYTPANVTSLALTNSHVWYTDKNSNIYHCSIFSGGLQWVRASGQARQISVSRSGHIVWRLHGNKAFAGSRITSKNPEGMKWLDAVKEVQYISVDDTCAWYIKQNNEVMLQKGLSKDRPCFKSQNVVCPYVLKQVVCKSGVVWALTDQCRLVYRTGITKKCPEGTDWAEYECSSTAEDFLFNSVTLGDGNVGWALDVVGRIWFMTDVTMETPIGDSHWWQVPVSEILVQDVTAIDTLRLLAKKFDPQKLADLMKSQQEGLIAAGRGGVWVCPDSKNTIRVCRSTVEGHLWEESLLVGIASSACWKLISATGCYGQSGIVWATQPNGDIFTFSPSSDKCSTVKRPVNKGLYVSLSASQNTVWILTDESKVYIRTGISARDPQGVDWYDLDMSQLGDVLMVSVACSTHNVWAVDSDGMVYQRIGVNAPSSYSLNPAWLPVDTSNVGNNFIQIAAGPKDYMVWAVDNRKQVYMRLGITEEMPIGENWIHIPGTPASQLIITEKHVWALNPNGEILCRYGITPKNPGGDYWRKIPGVFTHISVDFSKICVFNFEASRSDELWGLSREGQIFHRKTKYLLRRQTNFKESPNPKVSGSQSGEEGWELV
ncbi:hypothetical protein FSP39_011469 [Pinctada imbricata]|uniref:Tectonin beta-propeller repeat-containing protein 2 n=1 Tax=Pinctada imbricata TaxID=66713 RepID=A0AA89BRS5_PINIB|nr:hypothetical protein FSP39_011469 [Pinctada imbricata]